MYCQKCGKQIPDNSRYCPVCGADLGKDFTPNRDHSVKTSFETHSKIPLFIIGDYIKRHNKAFLVGMILILLMIIGIIVSKKYVEKQQAEKIFEAQMNHLAEIVGTYKSSKNSVNKMILVLNTDRTAILTTISFFNDSINHLGHWEEKEEGYPIEIDFSDSFELRLGVEAESYCSSIYFFNDALWPNLDAIQSQDYYNCEAMVKQKKK